MCHAFDFSFGKEIVWKIIFLLVTMAGTAMISMIPSQRAGMVIDIGISKQRAETDCSRQIPNHHLFKLVIFLYQNIFS